MITRTFVLAGLGLAVGSAFAAPGYVDDSGSSIVRTGYGDCLHTGRWSEQNYVPECDAVAEEPVEIAAVEVVIEKQLKPITLEADALFAFDSAELTDDGRAQLDETLGQLKNADIQDRRITITGHTDRLGPDSYNQPLSERRASAVQEYLVSKGVRDEIVDVKGMGSSQPLVGCEGERGDSLINCLAPNRRTTIEFSAMEVLEIRK